MEKAIKLSVLDLSVVRDGSDASQAVFETITTAKIIEQFGYHRFWVSEHHNSATVAGSAPELLMVRLAAETKSIRIGSGGIMLPNHSALKVAENFRMLETLYPGRIDLGMGRAPGTDKLTSNLLNPSNDFSQESYIEQLTHLQAFFRDEAAIDSERILAIPLSKTIPEQWILSSSGTSSSIAGHFGMGLAVAKFINGLATREVVEIYNQQFCPSEAFPEPRALLAIEVLCGETEEESKRLRKYWDYMLISAGKGMFVPSNKIDDINDYVFSKEEEKIISANSGSIVSGTPSQVYEQLTNMASDFGVDEIMISSITFKPEERIHSFELIAKAFAIK